MRSHYCGDLRATESGEEVEIYGWVHRRRDHGGVIFLDIRDRTGVLQVVFDPDEEQSFALADSVRNEYVLRAKGKVRPRPEGTINPDMPTGEIEVLGKELEILNAAKTPPFSSMHIPRPAKTSDCVTVTWILDGRRCNSVCRPGRGSPVPFDPS